MARPLPPLVAKRRLPSGACSVAEALVSSAPDQRTNAIMRGAETWTLAPRIVLMSSGRST
jgi:hypothetical protein